MNKKTNSNYRPKLSNELTQYYLVGGGDNLQTRISLFILRKNQVNHYFTLFLTIKNTLVEIFERMKLFFKEVRTSFLIIVMN